MRHAYAVELWTNEVPVSLRHAIVVIGLINVAFIAADWWTFTDKFWLCLAARILLTAALLLLWNPKSAKERLLAGLLLYSATGLMIIWVIVAAGGTASEYSPGLVLLLAGIPILLPVSALQASLVVGLLLATYTAIPWIDPDPISPRALILHLSFPWAAAFGALIACHRLDAVRFADYCKRHALQVAGEKLRALDEAKSRFIANINHELRTPLTLLLLPLEELLSAQDYQLSTTQREYLKIVQSNANRLLSLVNNVLAAAASANGQPEMLPRAIEIQSIIEDTISDLRPAAIRKRLELGTQGAAAGGAIIGDPEALKRVFLNIVDNAVKFTPVGGRIELSVASASDGVEIAAHDNGIGFQKHDAEQIFEPFIQLSDGPGRRDGGLGLGLAIARDIVERHGGRIWAESEGVGQGATIRVWLPRVAPHSAVGSRTTVVNPELGVLPCRAVGEKSIASLADQVEAQQSPFHEDSGARTPRTTHQVLVVEDNPEMRRLLARLLSQECHVRTAISGNEALQQIRDDPPDLVLADIMMEGLSGIELCKAIKDDDAIRGIPVILVTALADQDDRISGLELGADDYLAKPFRARELVARVRSLLKLRSVQRDLIVRNRALEDAIEALNASKRRSELYSRAVSHDLRGPIAAAGAAINAAIRTQPAETEAVLSIAAENLSRADRMLVALRSLARTVGTPEESDDIEVGALVEDVIAGVRLARGGHPLPVSLGIDRGRLRGRPEKLGHVLRNLIENALRAIEGREDGQVWVEVREESGQTIVRVIDNGCGIPASIRQAIFEPFQRGPCSRPGSLGIGLALARQIVEEHGGKIDVESQPGEGSSFTVTLPLMIRQVSNA